MAAKAQITTSAAVEYEVSGGIDGTLTGSREFTVGAQGGMIQFLTLRPTQPGKITVKCTAGKLSVEQDGGKGKSVSTGKSLTLSSKVKRALVKEAASETGG